MHLVDLDGAKAGRPVQLDLIRTVVSAAPLSVQVGGGVREIEHICSLLDAGAHRVVVGTKALEDWHWFERISAEDRFSGKLVLALDAHAGIVATRGWTASSGKRAIDIARWVSGWPLAGILYTDIARDGMMGGANLEHTRALAEAGKVPVIASGGVGTVDHIRELARIPILGVIVGRSLYEGTLDFKQAQARADALAAQR